MTVCGKAEVLAKKIFDESILDKYQDILPYPDEGRNIILLTVLQAKRDLVNLCDTESETEKETWQTAYDFLFSNDYYIMWGDVECRLEDLLDTLGIDILWARRKIRYQLAKQFERREKRGQEKEGSRGDNNKS